MSNDVIITVENLSKRYRLGQIGATSLRESAERLWHCLRGRDPDVEMGIIGVGQRIKQKATKETKSGDSRPHGHAAGISRDSSLTSLPSVQENEIWALKDVSFEVKRGEVLGIIGKNGAGKSTLLKILSRITEPTTGRAIMRGRVGSLLEVGTGFHPELTGGENIYLSGTILGMKKAEIAKKFDEIVAFAELERFIDTPIKRYSSGMYVRLGFAVAAHLEPEILLIDEVLAVGDASFQKKCLGKMGDVAKQGRTVLFVSHNMAAVIALCSKSYLLDFGRVVCGGDTGNVVDRYMQLISKRSAIPLSQRKDRFGTGAVVMTSFSIKNATGSPNIRSRDCLCIEIGYRSEYQVSHPTFKIGIYDQFNRPVFFLNSDDVGGLPDVIPDRGVVCCETGPINVTSGLCIFNAAVLTGGTMADHITNICELQIEAEDFYGTGKQPKRNIALCLLRQKWEAQGY